jgi:hypothetical protein
MKVAHGDTPIRSRVFNKQKGSPLSVMDVEVGFWDARSLDDDDKSSLDLRMAHSGTLREPARQLLSYSLEVENNVDRRQRTKLSDLVCQRKWAEARDRLASESGRHDIREMISIPFLSQYLCHALPLHLACALRPLPPASFVRLLIELYPDAVKVKEETWGMLPLHFAVKMSQYGQGGQESTVDLVDLWNEGYKFSLNDASNPLERQRERTSFNQRRIVTTLVEAYPESLWSKERFSGMLPIHIACSTASSQYESLTSNAAETLEMLARWCPGSIAVQDDRGETPRDVAWRNATFNCLRCKGRGRYIASVHGRCPHVAPSSKGVANPMLREDLECYLEAQDKCVDETMM